jgi:AcrR family transcriptional regulator
LILNNTFDNEHVVPFTSWMTVGGHERRTAPVELSRTEQILEKCSELQTRMSNKRDRRVQRTEQLLREALFALVQEKGFEPLSVQDIIDRANVGRATFYAHFDNKEDLLVSGFDDLRAALRRRQREGLSRPGDLGERVLAFSGEMFSHANEYRDVFRAMARKNSGALVQELFRKLLVDLVRDDIKVVALQPSPKAVTIEALVQFVAGALFGVLMWWLDGKLRLSPRANDVFRRLSVPAIRAAIG